MTTRTRYFVIASLLVLVVGTGSGLVAYYSSGSLGLRRAGGPEEFKYVPQDATVLAYADVQDVMHSQLRQKVHQAMGSASENGQREFQDETDIEHIVAFAESNGSETIGHGGMVLARGTFDQPRIENLLRDHGARSEDYKGTKVFVAPEGMHHAVEEMHRQMGSQMGQMGSMSGSMDGAAPHADTRPEHPNSFDDFALSFIEPRLVAIGNVGLVRAAIDRKNGPNITSNDDMMKMVHTLDSGNAWAVGRFDAIQKQAHLPGNIASQIPPITWFSVSSHIDGGVSGTIRAETRDEEAANNLRDVVGGFLALAKMQAGSMPQYQDAMRSLEVSVSGKTVALSFMIPAEVFDAIGAAKGLPGQGAPMLPKKNLK